MLAAQRTAIPYDSFPIDAEAYPKTVIANTEIPNVDIEDVQAFEAWKSTNIVPQKQKGYVAVGIKVLLGDFYTDKARKLADLVQEYAAGELRLSLRQNILIPYVKEDLVPYFYTALKELDFVGGRVQ